ncbi:glycosyltransferase family 2 protein [Kaistella flava (ex Peng et al. 2021)]|uniref:Glycosyltransferase family 2 protein n=1 Tax=Kaistella flava (ex Peng et al. 2021) TaxID=2038776 RepID=A0A7M2YB66_9FLAO|nr:glycosyltransferase family A protein [Kaistella flava (ex Peng et al. 2021)]QOW10885.1 glycosyltransferase family 2 protein [Kaistella flava (ex Peng et al. 2021)]
MQLTIFTPTYNRAYILETLFQSLLKQTVRDFEWLIIDDGSIDNTAELVAKFIGEADFPIQYIKQENQGKHIAINVAASNSNADYILTIDSDDYLSPNCVGICKELVLEIAEDNKFAGFTFILATEKVNLDCGTYGHQRWLQGQTCDWGFQGEMNFVLQTRVMREFPFPSFHGENFCQESVLLNRILQRYKILFTDHVLAFGEYLEDGLSQNLYQRLLDNPNYSMLSLKTKLAMVKTDEEKMQLTKSYWDIALKTNQSKIKSFLDFPLLLNLLYFKYRILQKF